MRLDDDILLLVLDKLSTVDMFDMVSSALTNHRVHSLAQKHLSEHQYLLRFERPCLSHACTHEHRCTFVAKHPADILEVCQPGSKVFDYIGSDSKYLENSDTYQDSLRLEGIRKAKAIPYLHDLFANRVDPNGWNDFWQPRLLEKLFLFLLKRPVVIQMPSIQMFRGHVSDFLEVHQEFGYEMPVPNPANPTRLLVSAIESLGNLSRLTRNTLERVMHFIFITQDLQDIFRSTTFWTRLGILATYMEIEKADIHLGRYMDGHEEELGKLDPYGDILPPYAFGPRTSKQRQLRFTGSLGLRPIFADSERLKDCMHERPWYTVDVTENELDDYFEITFTRDDRS